MWIFFFFHVFLRRSSIDRRWRPSTLTTNVTTQTQNTWIPIRKVFYGLFLFIIKLFKDGFCTIEIERVKMRWRVRNRRAESDREQWFCILGQSESIFRNMTSFSSRFRTRYIFQYITYWEFFPSFIPNFLSSHFMWRGLVFGCPVFLFIPWAHLQKEILLSTLFQVRKILSLNFRITISSTTPLYKLCTR